MRLGLAVLVIYVTGLLHTTDSINPACDCVIYQSHGLNSGGRFTSPDYPHYYPSNINCILYTFIGDANELIELRFSNFDLKMPDPSGRCHDFLRIFMNLDRPEVNEHNMHDLEFCGSFESIQKTVYSSYRSLVLEFHSDVRKGRPGNYTGFMGVYKFLDARNFKTTGIQLEGEDCTYEFYSNSTHSSGRFFSPSYPQHYKPNVKCKYRFHARPRERVQIQFSNIQLYHVESNPTYYRCLHSPDVIRVYDGPDETAPMIGQYCGVHNAEERVSTGTQLFVAFTSDDRDQLQGFAATYEFISNFPRKGPKSIDFNNSEFGCNENIDSRTHKNGTIMSPFHPGPYPAYTMCRYVFVGVGRERIQLRFTHFDLHFPTGNPNNPHECKDSDSVSVYIVVNDQREQLKTWCGKQLPPMLMSSRHTMIVEFRSFSSSPVVTGFKADYSFVTNFGIHQGQQDSRGVCMFEYSSNLRSSGEITSPNYNGWYPRNTECQYLFYGQQGERVRLRFVDFDVDGISPQCENSTKSDFVSFSNFAETEDRKMTKLCGTPPEDKRVIVSDGPFFKVVFKSNHLYDATGFLAHYQFIKDSVGGASQGGKQITHNTYSVQDPNGNSGNSNMHPTYGNSHGGFFPFAHPLSLLISTLSVMFVLPRSLFVV